MTTDLKDITVSPNRPLLSKKQAAAALGITFWTLDRWRKAGLIHPVQGLGARVRYHPAEVERVARGEASTFGQPRDWE